MAGKSIAENLMAVHESIERSCARSGRRSDDVRLIAVSKSKSVDMVSEALAAGQTRFGENYVQEALTKTAALPNADWHFIGTLQTNKARLVVGKFSLLQSLDRDRLADELNRVAKQMGLVQNVLLQVHIGDEASKAGVALNEAPRLIEHILKLPHLRLCGVMSLPPISSDERVGRRYFSELREAFLNWRAGLMTPDQAAHFTELSMGTSSDFEWAILEGATMVRVGTNIFGAREN